MNQLKRNNLWVLLPLVLLIAVCDSPNEVAPEPKISGRLVFAMPDETEKHNFQIYTSNTDGSDRKQLTNYKSDESVNPAWSPDGEQIAFVTTLRSSSAGGSLYLMNADGSNIRPLKERPGSSIVTTGSNPAWSPDGSKIAFDWCTNCELGGRNYELFVYDFETDLVSQITDTVSLDFYPKWKNSEEIYFITDRDYYIIDSLRTNEDIYSVNINDGSISRVTKTGGIGSLTLNKATNSIFVRPENGDDDWYFLDIDTNDSTFFEFPSSIFRIYTSAVTWSEDGKWVLLRNGASQAGAVFIFLNIETGETFMFNEEPFRDGGMDWFTKQ